MIRNIVDVFYLEPDTHPLVFSMFYKKTDATSKEHKKYKTLT